MPAIPALMPARALTVLTLCVLGLLIAAPLPAAEATSPRQITWDDLIPEGWVPPSVSVDHFFDDTPPQAVSGADAPVVTALDGIRVRLPGYLVPITLDGEKLKDFLMVPYFGACIHVPPPPPNQVVFVSLPEGVTVEDPYGPHWVTGTLSASTSRTDLAEAAYTMAGERVEVFDWDTMFPEQIPEQAEGSDGNSD